ncbi:LysR family transcriptional regulator [Parasedimentitalea maritima]|uniref:LysR family transcriptional regulator n=1 Tax=Parasedimentitalea maritima TaxID=2578117 RepID=A0A6A4RBI6_9RHOB|nr:LysR family transcriptional regulator [Zongyanglinia marina]KAE9627586.1 LysR family transcriptional regulator [Zongyanglinia marina]
MTDRNFKMPPLEWIRAFEATARLGSFTAAAAETGLTQSAISQRIGHLEKLLNTALFHRRSRTIELTLEGEAWLPHVRASLNSLRDSSEALFGAVRGSLTFSASQSIIDLWLQPRLHLLCDLSTASISVQTMVLGAHSAPQDDVIRIRYGSGDWPHDYKLKLFDEQIVPVASPKLLKGQDHWTQWPRIACSGPRPGWNDWASRFDTPTTPLPKWRFDTLLPALGAARVGMGVLLTSQALCKADLASGRLVQLGSDILQHHESYWLLASRDAVSRAQWEKLAAAMRHPLGDD